MESTITAHYACRSSPTLATGSMSPSRVSSLAMLRRPSEPPSSPTLSPSLIPNSRRLRKNKRWRPLLCLPGLPRFLECELSDGRGNRGNIVITSTRSNRVDHSLPKLVLVDLVFCGLAFHSLFPSDRVNGINNVHPRTAFGTTMLHGIRRELARLPRTGLATL